jgi:hypothetical protein
VSRAYRPPAVWRWQAAGHRVGHDQSCVRPILRGETVQREVRCCQRPRRPIPQQHHLREDLAHLGTEQRAAIPTVSCDIAEAIILTIGGTQAPPEHGEALQPQRGRLRD